MIESHPVLVARAGGVATLTINRPGKRNALSLAVVDWLIAALRTVCAEPDIRSVVITGAGSKAFAAGADLEELPEAFETPASARAYDARVSELYQAIEACPRPVVARMNGHAIGGGLLLALACDLRCAVDTAKVGIPSGRIGLMLSPCEYRLVQRNLPPSKARLLLFAGTILRAVDAQEWGLVDQVHPPAEFDAALDQLLSNIAAAAPLSTTVAKRLLSLPTTGDATARDTIASAYETIYRSQDLREGLSASLAKRQPVFTGR